LESEVVEEKQNTRARCVNQFHMGGGDKKKEERGGGWSECVENSPWRWEVVGEEKLEGGGTVSRKRSVKQVFLKQARN